MVIMGIVGKETVTITSKIKTGFNDARGNPEYVTVSTVVTGVLVAPGAYITAVDIAGYETEETVTFYLPLSTQIDFKDLITYKNQTYALTTTPQKWVPPKGSPLRTKIIAIGQVTKLGENYGV